MIIFSAGREGHLLPYCLFGSKETFPLKPPCRDFLLSLAQIGLHAHPELILGHCDGATTINLDSSGFPLPPGIEAEPEILVWKLVIGLLLERQEGENGQTLIN